MNLLVMAVAMIPLIKEWMLHFLQKLNMEQLELNFTGMHRVYFLLFLGFFIFFGILFCFLFNLTYCFFMIYLDFLFYLIYFS